MFAVYLYPCHDDHQRVRNASSARTAFSSPLASSNGQSPFLSGAGLHLRHALAHLELFCHARKTSF